MNNKELNDLLDNMPLPDIRPLPVSGWEQKLYLAYAFMHNDQVDSGDISFLDKTDGEEVLKINRDSFPETIEEFINKVEESKATQFHARCQYEEYYSIALISDGYDFMSQMFMGNIPQGCYIHAGAVEKEDIVNKICNQTADNYEALLLGKKLMPIYHRPNPIELVNRYVPKKDGKIHIDYSKMNLEPDENGEYAEYFCARSAYDFRCIESIKCCGECPLLKQVYDDTLKVLDEETKAKLINVSSKLFGKCNACNSCKKERCNKDVWNAINYINCSYFECFKDPEFGHPSTKE